MGHLGAEYDNISANAKRYPIYYTRAEWMRIHVGLAEDGSYFVPP